MSWTPDRGRQHTATPRLAIGAGGRTSQRESESYRWIVHERQPRVAFLVSPLVGMSAAEQLRVEVRLDHGEQLVATMQGPATLLKTERAAEVTWHLILRRGSHLTYLPWATIPFPGARHRSRVVASLDRPSTLIAWEVLSVGRIARGEQFLFMDLESELRVEIDDRAILSDRLRISGGDADDGEAMLAGQTHLGTLVLAGIFEEILPLDAVVNLLPRHEGIAGAGRPDPGLIVVRMLGASAQRIERAFWPIVSLGRAVLGLAPLTTTDVARRGLCDWIPATASLKVGGVARAPTRTGMP